MDISFMDIIMQLNRHKYEKLYTLIPRYTIQKREIHHITSKMMNKEYRCNSILVIVLICEKFI